MRPGSTMTKSRRARLGYGALMIGIPVAGAAALTTGQTAALADIVSPSAPGPAPTASAMPLQIHVHSRQIAFDHKVTVSGTAPSSAARDTVVLEFAPGGTNSWRRLGSGTVGSTGSFRLAGPLEQSGLVRALDVTSATAAPLLAGNDDGAAATSNTQRVEVKARLRVGTPQIGTLAGQAIAVRGQLLPGRAGRKVSLQGVQAGGWNTLATARTGGRGRFLLRFVADGSGQEPIRVRFAGDPLNGRAIAPAGQLTIYRLAVASWYDDAGSTACGFHAYYGVANKTLPCGTKVALRYNGRSVTAVVDDRGPYVAGRDWDLNQNTAATLGFDGIDTVWSSM